MLTLSGAPDCVVNWSDFSFQHTTVRKLTIYAIQFFQAFTGFVILIACWSSVVVEPFSFFVDKKLQLV